MAGAKAQNAPLGILLAVFTLGLLRLRKDAVWTRIIGISCILLVLTTAITYLSVPENIKVCNKYQSVFFGILKDSPTPKEDLKELGLNQEFSVLAGTSYFMQEYPLNIRDPLFLAQIGSKISPFKVAAFYIHHPSRYMNKLAVTAQNAFTLVQGVGNYEKSENMPFRKTTSSFLLWSNFKNNYLPHSLLFLGILFTGYTLVLLLFYFKKKNSFDRILLEVFMLVGAIGVTQFLIPILGDGEADLSKHLFLFNVCFDVIFISSIVWILHFILKAANKSLSACFSE